MDLVGAIFVFSCSDLGVSCKMPVPVSSIGSVCEWNGMKSATVL